MSATLFKDNSYRVINLVYEVELKFFLSQVVFHLDASFTVWIIDALHILPELEALRNHLDIVCKSVKEDLVREVNYILEVSRDFVLVDKLLVEEVAVPLFEHFYHVEEVMLTDPSLVCQTHIKEDQAFVAVRPAVNQFHDHFTEGIEINSIQALKLVLEEQDYLLADLVVIPVLQKFFKRLSFEPCEFEICDVILTQRNKEVLEFKIVTEPQLFGIRENS